VKNTTEGKYLDSAVVNLDSIELRSGLYSASRLVEDDRRNTATLAVLSVRKKNLLDRSYGLGEIILSETGIPR